MKKRRNERCLHGHVLPCPEIRDTGEILESLNVICGKVLVWHDTVKILLKKKF